MQTVLSAEESISRFTSLLQSRSNVCVKNKLHVRSLEPRAHFDEGAAMDALTTGMWRTTTTIHLVDSEWARLQEGVIAFSRLRKREDYLRNLSVYVCVLTSIRIQSFELFRLCDKSTLLFDFTIKISIQGMPRNTATVVSPFIYLRMRDGDKSRHLVPSSPLWHCPPVTSRGRKFHISIHTDTVLGTARRITSHDSTTVNTEGRKPAIYCNTASRRYRISWDRWWPGNS